MVCNQFDCAIKVLRSDNGTEFFNIQVNELLSSFGIIHQSSCAYTPQQNGIVERKHRHILVLMGFSSTQKGYKLYDLEAKIMFISRDVVFRETVFPFKLMQSVDTGPCPLLVPFLDNVDDANNDVNDVNLDSCHDHIEESSNNTDGLQESSHSPHNEPATKVVSRRTTRTSKPPVWIKDYVVPHKSSPHSITNHVRYDNVFSGYQSYLQALSAAVEP
ncbi:uncharacterized protein [Solanum lycopersicum]|uniref:uncharacterized protein n=1 Tax=Solanum lycopersicum TaxID=4081 RepID=UPI0037481556